MREDGGKNISSNPAVYWVMQRQVFWRQSGTKIRIFSLRENCNINEIFRKDYVSAASRLTTLVLLQHLDFRDILYGGVMEN
jgi:hypothetical protein